MSFLAAPNRVPLADIPSVAFYFYHFSPSFSLFRAYIFSPSRENRYAIFRKQRVDSPQAK